MRSTKTDKVVSIAKTRSKECEEKALKAIEDLENKGEHITYYKVEQCSGVSRSTLYNNPRISKLIKEKRNQKRKE